MIMNKYLKLIALAVIIFGIQPVWAAEGNSGINLIIPNAPGYIQNQTDAEFKLEFNVRGVSNSKYTLEYSFDEYKTVNTIEYDITPNTRIVKSVDLSGLDKGIYKIYARVRLGEDIVFEDTGETSIIEFYQRQWLDDYSRIGMSSHMDDTTEPEVIALAGVRSVRTNKNWSGSESTKGQFDFSAKRLWSDRLADLGLTLYSGATYGNTLYIKDSTWKAAPRKAEDVEAYKRYVLEYLKAHPEIEEIEIWNEPNILSFWPTGVNVNEYIAMVKTVGKAIKEYNSEMVVIAGVIASSRGEIYLEQMMEAGCLPYIDGIAFHPYIYPSDPDIKFVSNCMRFDVPLEKSGDWVDKYLSEMGWPTHIGSSGTSEENQAVYLTKLFVLNDYLGYEKAHWYNFKNKGVDESYNEDNFGIVRADYTAKPAYISLAQTCKQLNAARYIGKYSPVTGVEYYCYTKDNKPFVVAWATGDEIPYKFKNSNVRIEDKFGNVIEVTDDFKFTKEPYYIFGLDENTAALAASSMILESIDAFRAKWENKLDFSVLSELENAAEFEKNLSEAEAHRVFKAIFGAGNRILAKRDTATSEEDMMCMLYQLYEINNKFVNYYAYRINTPKSAATEKNIAALDKLINERKNNDESVVFNFTEVVRKYANRYAMRAKEVEQRDFNPAQNGLVGAFNEMAVELCKWSKQILDFEALNSGYSVLTYVNPGKITTIQGRDDMVEMTVANKSNTSIDGEILTYNSEGTEVSEKIPVKILKGETKSVNVPITISAHETEGDKSYRICLYSDGKVLQEHNLLVTVTNAVKIALLPTDKSVNLIDKVELNIEANIDEVIKGDIEIIPPDGWTIDNSKQSFRVDMASGGIYTFNVSSAKQVPFNEYVFNVILRDEKGEIINNQKLSLDFLRVIKANEKMSAEGFDGNIESWANAYPIHFGMPQDADKKEAWNAQNIGARAFAKWDDSNLYYLVDIYDDIHLQTYGGNDMWRGDSVQVSLDVLNDGGTKYGSDDYEFGFTFAPEGNSAYAFTAPEGKVGEYPKNMVSVIRDDDKHITRYLIVISKSEVPAIELKNGNVFGYNIGVNDADILSRDQYIQFTKGTCDTKRPDYYYDFILAPYEMGEKYVDDRVFDAIINNHFTINSPE